MCHIHRSFCIRFVFDYNSLIDLLIFLYLKLYFLAVFTFSHLAVNCRFTLAALATTYEPLNVLQYIPVGGAGLSLVPWSSAMLSHVIDFDPRRRLRSVSTAALIVRPTLHSSIGDRSFPVAAARTWNSLPTSVIASQSLQTFRKIEN